MGRHLRELRAALQIPFLRDVSADEPPLCLHDRITPRPGALLSARRHPCGAGLVPERRARRRALQAVRAELTASRRRRKARGARETRIAPPVNEAADDGGTCPRPRAVLVKGRIAHTLPGSVPVALITPVVRSEGRDRAQGARV